MTTKSLNAVVLGALIALGAAGCANHPTQATYSGNKQERTATQEISDGALSARIKTSFAADSLVKARDIKVDVLRGVVTLSGMVDNTAQRDKAIQIARDTKGVTEVKNNLKVAG